MQGTYLIQFSYNLSFHTKGDHIVDLTEDLAAEQKARAIDDLLTPVETTWPSSGIA